MNKKLLKRMVAGALSLCLLGALTACGGGLTEKDAETYIKGHLDAYYLGTYAQEYIELVEDMTEDDAKEMHRDNVEWEVEYLLQKFMEVEYPTDEMAQRAEKLIEEVYSKAQYQVGSASKTKDGDFVVEVTVSPIEVVSLLTEEDFSSALEESGFNAAETEEAAAAADAVYGMLMLDKLEELVPQLTYGEDQIIMLQLKAGEDGYYTLVDSGIQKLDEVMIDYYGTYTK